MKRVLVATTNQGKLAEFREALSETQAIDVVGLEALTDRSEVEESGTNFEDNARLKAAAYSLRTDLPVLAEDSGLEVDALDGAPGVHSARYGGSGLDDAGRNRNLLEALANVGAEAEAQRSARFRCVLAVAKNGSTLATFSGTIEGRIAHAPRGANGFGYDPLFFHPPSARTTAELTIEEKRRVSHRGQAIAAFLQALRTGDTRLAELGLSAIGRG
jgi:XTP/dITP diphosphohydrolase